MRSNKSKSEFFRKMKKKPAVQEVIDNLDKYSKEDIFSLRGSVFPKWIRNELVNLKEESKKYKERGNKTAGQLAKELAEKMPVNEDNTNYYAVYQYTTSGHGTYQQFDINAGDILSVLKDNFDGTVSMRINTFSSRNVPKDISQQILDDSDFLGEMTLPEMSGLVQDYLTEKYN